MLVRLLDCLVACVWSSEFSAGLINHTNAGLEITKYANLYHIIFVNHMHTYRLFGVFGDAIFFEDVILIGAVILKCIRIHSLKFPDCIGVAP